MSNSNLLMLPFALVCIIVLTCVWYLVRSLLVCQHDHLGWPIGNTQRCLQCGAVRPYVMGEHPGKWGREKVLQASK